MDHTFMGRQIAAARALAGQSQAELATSANISVPTLKRMEASSGAAAGLRNNVAAVRAALEAAGVDFIAENGGGAGVRLKRKTLDAAEITKQIQALDDKISKISVNAEASPEAGMNQLRGALARNDRTKLKNRRAKK